MNKSTVGASDITGSVYGRRLEIEVKIGDNGPSPKQLSWLRDRNDELCITGCVWSLEEAQLIVMGAIAENGVSWKPEQIPGVDIDAADHVAPLTVDDLSRVIRTHGF